MKKQVGFVCFGEVNTPIERLNLKHDDALSALAPLGYNLLDGGLVIDDPGYQTADAAVEKLRGFDMACLIVCVAGWIPTHAVIRVTDHFRHIPMLLWGLCGWQKTAVSSQRQIRPALRPSGRFRSTGLYVQIRLQYHRSALPSFEDRRLRFRLLREKGLTQRPRRHHGIPRHASLWDAV